MTSAEFYTSQFYSWEYRCRGWMLSASPIHLEPPFIPFYRHGFPQAYIDDGKRHTIISKVIESLKGKPSIIITPEILPYETIEQFNYENEEPLSALRVQLNKEWAYKPENLKTMLLVLSNEPSITSFEIIGTNNEIIIQFVCNESRIEIVQTFLNSFFPKLTILQNDDYLGNIIKPGLSTAMVDFGLSEEFVRPLQMNQPSSIDPLTAMFGILEGLKEYEQGGFQVLFQPVLNDWHESIIRSVTMYDGSSFFYDVPDAPKLATDKVHSPLYGVTLRAFAQSPELPKAFSILEKLASSLVYASKSNWNALLPLSDEAYDFETRVEDIILRQSHRLGMLLNLSELTNLLHFPFENIQSKKLFPSKRTTKEVPIISKNKPFTIGTNQHNGLESEVSCGIEDRLKHMHIIGATGTGKSTLLANLLLQDIDHRHAVVLFDPHGDLVEEIISRIPKNRLDDVVLVDPSDIEFPIGLNLLQATSDIEKEILCSDLVAIFRKYATSWGDQMNTVFSNAVHAIIETKDGGTLNDLRRFLIEREYRNTVLTKVNDPSVIYYWEKEFPLLKSNSIGPILTRLDTFLRPKSIRHMVVQKSGLNFEKLLDSNKIILFKLSQGLIGVENSYLLGSLILTKIHQAILKRQQQVSRFPVLIYLDEFQNFLTPSINEMISGVRKYNVGLILCHQSLQQLQRESVDLLNTVLGNVNISIVFRVGEQDAKRLQDGFTGFDFHDFQNLSMGEAVMKMEQPQFDCSVDTFSFQPVSDKSSSDNRQFIIDNCHELYATTKAEVEQILFQSFGSVSKETMDIGVKEESKIVDVKKTTSVDKVKSEKISREKLIQSEENISTHRYLQTLVKKMAEDKGYTAILESLLLEGKEKVDVLLTKDSKTIAVEISNTTDADWEVHNISKCINAKYDCVVSLAGDQKQIEKIKARCYTIIPNFEQFNVLFFTPDMLFSFLNENNMPNTQEEITIKGYRVNVTYDSVTNEEMKKKRATVANVIKEAVRKQINRNR